MERKPLSKRLRFEIFKRDGFRCHYCGAVPIGVAMHVDHVKPVVDGGTDEAHNLVTACADCNLGKNRVPLEKKKLAVGRLTEADMDHAEQIREYLAVQREVGDARGELKAHLVSEWEHRVGEAPKKLASRVVGMATEFGIERLMEAFDIIGDRGPSYSSQQLPYLHGILKRWRSETEVAEPPVPDQAVPANLYAPMLKNVWASINRAMEHINANQPDELRALEAKRSFVAASFADGAGADMDETKEIAKRAYASEEPLVCRGLRLTWTKKENGKTSCEIKLSNDPPEIWAYWRIAGEIMKQISVRERAKEKGEQFDDKAALDAIGLALADLEDWVDSIRNPEAGE